MNITKGQKLQKSKQGQGGLGEHIISIYTDVYKYTYIYTYIYNNVFTCYNNVTTVTTCYNIDTIRYNNVFTFKYAKYFVNSILIFIVNGIFESRHSMVFLNIVILF